MKRTYWKTRDHISGNSGNILGNTESLERRAKGRMWKTRDHISGNILGNTDSLTSCKR